MKKKAKKLELHRETIATLDGEIRHARGGGLSPATGLTTSNYCDFPTACDCASEAGCGGGNTWEHTCTILCCSSMAHC